MSSEELRALPNRNSLTLLLLMHGECSMCVFVRMWSGVFLHKRKSVFKSIT